MLWRHKTASGHHKVEFKLTIRTRPFSKLHVTKPQAVITRSSRENVFWVAMQSSYRSQNRKRSSQGREKKGCFIMMSINEKKSQNCKRSSQGRVQAPTYLPEARKSQNRKRSSQGRVQAPTYLPEARKSQNRKRSSQGRDPIFYLLLGGIYYVKVTKPQAVITRSSYESVFRN